MSRRRKTGWKKHNETHGPHGAGASTGADHSENTEQETSHYGEEDTHDNTGGVEMA